MRLASIKMAAHILVFFLAAAIVRSAEAFPVPSNSPTKSVPGKSSDQKSAAGLPSLPKDAQGPISAALGKDDSRYWLHPSADGFRGENVRGLAVEFTKEGGGVRRGNLRWGLETRAYGYGDRLRQVKMAAPQASANRVEYRRDGVTEWYLNGPLGLEQGFTLEQPPGRRNGHALTLELGLRGNLTAALEPGGTGLELKDNDGKAALRYTGLTARDANGRELRSWLEVRAEQLLVRVEDEGARYPVVVDPVLQQAELTASDATAGEEFGSSVAFDGTTIVVGAFRHAVGSSLAGGAVYVFVHSSDGTWSQQAELVASDGGGDLGSTVALNGNTIVAGAPGHAGFQGAAYVFVQSGGTWSQQAELAASDGAADDLFGTSVAFDGTTIAVGAPGHAAGQGAAYVFVQSGGTWSQQAELAADSGPGNNAFGSSIGVDGTTIVVGSEYAVGSNLLQGAAFVFVESGGTWSLQTELTAKDGKADDQFGTSVAISGTTIVVGAPLHPVGSTAGAAYVFVESGGTWSQQAELTASDGGTFDNFGTSVAVDGTTGTTIVVGKGSGLISGQGAAYVFVQSGKTWSQQEKLVNSDGVVDREFAASVAVSGGTIVAGDPLHPRVPEDQAQGAAYVFAPLGPNQPAVNFTPALLDFGVLHNSSPALTKLLTVTNIGAATLDITSLTINGDFAISANTCGSTLDVNASCSVDVTFNPVKQGTETGTLSFADNDTFHGSPQAVLLSGGFVPATLTPPSVVYASQAQGTTSPARTFTLTNDQLTALTNIVISTTGDFQVSATTCGTSLAAKTSCTISVTFTPTATGTRTGTLSVSDSASINPETSSLRGVGTVPATLNPASATYPSRAVGTTSPALAFVLANHETIALTNIVISTTGDFAVSATTCGTSLAPSGTCTISVTFTPTAAGTRTGMLSVSDSASTSPQTSNLTGTGL